MSVIKTKRKEATQARFDARLTRMQKELFEQAARIQGFKSLSEFVIHTTQEAATRIIEKQNVILASEKDRVVFIDALINPPKPNKALLAAKKLYLMQVAGK